MTLPIPPQPEVIPDGLAKVIATLGLPQDAPWSQIVTTLRANGLALDGKPEDGPGPLEDVTTITTPVPGAPSPGSGSTPDLSSSEPSEDFPSPPEGSDHEEEVPKGFLPPSLDPSKRLLDLTIGEAWLLLTAIGEL